jgi:hypothetical protein
MEKLISETYMRDPAGSNKRVEMDEWLNERFEKGYEYVSHVNELNYLGVTFIFKVEKNHYE